MCVCVCVCVCDAVCVYDVRRTDIHDRCYDL